jgi:hypothetical protein
MKFHAEESRADTSEKKYMTEVRVIICMWKRLNKTRWITKVCDPKLKTS